MDRDEIMQLAADKAIKELSWDSIEFLFRPATLFELLLRTDFDNMVQKTNEWVADPSILPWNSYYSSEQLRIIRRAIQVEEFYRLLCSMRDKP